MAMYVDPITNPDVFDRVIFGKLATPGKCLVEGWSRDNEYDIKVGRGTAGATETLKGQPPAKGKFTFWAWTAEHFRAWTPILALLKYKPGKGAAQTTAPQGTDGSAFTQGQTKNDSGGGSASSAIPQPGNTSGVPNDPDAFKGPKQPPALSKNDAIAVYYPTLADIGVTSIIPPEKLGAWEPDGEAAGGMWKRTIDAVEFMQAGNQNIATTPTGTSDGNAPGTTPAGGSEGAAPGNAASQAKGAGSDAQGAWGAP